MRKILKSAALVALLSAFVSCGSGNTLITQNSVGDVTFTQEVPDMGSGYTTAQDVMYFDSEEVPFYVVKNKKGELVANIFTGQSIEVYSPEFKTENGIHPGMNLHEAALIAGEENLHIWLGWPNNYFTIDDSSSGLSWSVYGNQLLGGLDEFQRHAAEGTPVALAQFSPDAQIGWITVVNYENED